LTLTGANTYSGGTTILGGTLFANTAAPDSATGSGAVVVNGGTLAGNGNVAGDVALQSGAIAPGGSAGAVATLSTGALIWSGGAIDLQLGATPSASDAIVVAGALSKAGSGPHVFHFSDGASPPVTCGTTYTLIQASSISGFAESDFSFDYSGSATGFAGRIAIAGNNVVLMGLCTQAIAFPAIPAQTYVSGGTFGVAATASSNLTVTFTSLTPSVCTVSGSTVTMLGTGTCTIAADQAGDATYAAASQITQDVTINPGTQAVLSASASPSSVAYGGTSTLSTTGGSGTGAVTYEVTTGAAYCSVSGNTLTGIGIGACTVTATKAGDGNYNAASATVDRHGRPEDDHDRAHRRAQPGHGQHARHAYSDAGGRSADGHGDVLRRRSHTRCRLHRRHAAVYGAPDAGLDEFDGSVRARLPDDRHASARRVLRGQWQLHRHCHGAIAGAGGECRGAAARRTGLVDLAARLARRFAGGAGAGAHAWALTAITATIRRSAKRLDAPVRGLRAGAPDPAARWQEAAT
jgi:hypothetical protein